MEKFLKSGLFLTVLAFALTIVLSVNGYAQTPPPAPPADQLKKDGGNKPPLTPEQTELRKKLFSDYAAKVKPVKKDLMDQRFIYEALKGNSTASVADINNVVSQMRKLRDQLDSLEAEFKDTYAKSGLPPLRDGFGKKGRHGGHGSHGGYDCNQDPHRKGPGGGPQMGGQGSGGPFDGVHGGGPGGPGGRGQGNRS
jgi:Spy/CpxP family protein refolding chaperone